MRCLQQISGTTPDQGVVGTFVGPGYTEGNPLTGSAKNFCNLLVSTGFGTQVTNISALLTPNSILLDDPCTIPDHAVRWRQCLASLLMDYVLVNRPSTFD